MDSQASGACIQIAPEQFYGTISLLFFSLSYLIQYPHELPITLFQMIFVSTVLLVRDRCIILIIFVIIPHSRYQISCSHPQSDFTFQARPCARAPSTRALHGLSTGEISPQCSLFPAPSLADTLLTPPFSNPQHHLCVAVIPTVPPTKPRCLHPYHTHPTLPLPPCQPRAKRLRPVSVFRAFLHSATLVVYHLPPLTRQFKMIVLICFEPCTHCCLLASSTLPCPTLPYLN